MRHHHLVARNFIQGRNVSRRGTGSFAVTILFASASMSTAFAQQGDGTHVTMSTTIFKPAKVPATPERIASIKAPPGFTVTAFATGLKNARVLAVSADGTVYLTRRDQGDVLI